MVKTITEWARDLIIISLAFAFTEMLLPTNDLQKFARVVMGIVMIAVILGSILDISQTMDDALEAQTEFTMGQFGTLSVPSHSDRGELIVQAGLQIVETNEKDKVTRQLESIARLASGANEAHADIRFTSSGNIKHIYVTLKGFGMQTLGTSDDDSSNLGERVVNAIRDFYGFSNDVAISVSVDLL